MCRGWYAINKNILNADVVINVAKLKTHRMMIMTACVKSYVGCLVNSTYDDTWRAERIPHYKKSVSGLASSFENDIFWRALGDVHTVLNYCDKTGKLQATVQRKSLHVIDAVEGVEKNHIGEYGGNIVVSNTIVAGTDAFAVDAVGARVMRYDYRLIPSIAMVMKTKNPITDQFSSGNIMVDAEVLGDTHNHCYQFSDRWEEEAADKGLIIHACTPPRILRVTTVRKGVFYAATVETSGADSAYSCFYRKGKYQRVVMRKNGHIFKAVLKAPDNGHYRVFVSDKHFNTMSAEQTL
jgi:hypothetical protein